MYKPYKEYVPQENIWLGMLPNSWTTKKIKHIVCTKVTDGPHTTPELLFDGVPFVSAEAVKDNRIDLEHKRGYISVEDHLQFCKKCKPQKHDIFMIKSGATTGKIAYVDIDDEFSIWSPLALIRSKAGIYYQRYVYYSMLSSYFTQQVEISWNYGTQQNIGMGIIENLHLFTCNYDDQVKIANFLDVKTKTIRMQIKKIEKMIELLKEKKEVLIIKAVTKGLNPDVTMKDSGIDWIGKIPKHWEVKRLKWTIKTEKNGSWGDEAKDDENDFICVRVADFNRNNSTVELYNPTIRSYVNNNRKDFILKNGDLLIEKSGGGELQPVGFVVYFENTEKCICSNFIAKLSLKKNNDPQYMKYLLRALYHLRINTKSIKQTTGIQNIDTYAYFQEIIPIPHEYTEQSAITDYIDVQTKRIESLMQKNQELIKKLTEYQEALITAAVTGKIDVRGE